MPTSTPSLKEEGTYEDAHSSTSPRGFSESIFEQKKRESSGAEGASSRAGDREEPVTPITKQEEMVGTHQYGESDRGRDFEDSWPDDSKGLSQRKKVGEISNVLLDMRRNLHADHNIVGPLRRDDKEKLGGESHADSGPKISNYTLVRAEKVKSILGMKYLYMRRMYEWSQDDNEQRTDSPIDGFYTPLQVIRNREIRAKHKIKIQPLAFKTLPLACNVFSSHNRRGHKNWKMKWAVDIDELFFDARWRNDFMHELKKPNGELWFPFKKNDFQIKPEHPERRLHDKIFQAEKSDDDFISKGSTSSGRGLSSDEDDNHIFRIHRRKRKPYSRFKGALQSRKYSNSISISSSGSTENDEESSSKMASGTNSSNQLKGQIFKRVSRSPERQLYANDSPNISVSLDDSRQDLPSTGAKPEVMSVGKLNIERIGKKDLSYKTDDVQESPLESTPSSETDLPYADYYKSLYYINAIACLRESHLQFSLPLSMESMLQKLDKIIETQINGILLTTRRINDDLLASNENLFSEMLLNVKSVSEVVNNNYSIRVDNLLTNADRPIGETHTSLSLELRKINERLDKLNLQLFKSSLADPSKESNFTANLSTQGDYRVLYLVLENFIVIILRVIWITANIYKLFMAILKFVLRVIMAILF